MTRISTFCALGSALAVLALSTNVASAENIKAPVVTVPQPKVNPSAVTSAHKGGTGGQPYLTYKFNDVVVTKHGTSGGGENPTESTSLNFTKQQYQYTNQTSGGQTSGGLHTDKASPGLFDKHKDW